MQVKLLTELHWSLPHPLTKAESVLKSKELPNMARSREQLRTQCNVSALTPPWCKQLGLDVSKLYIIQFWSKSFTQGDAAVFCSFCVFFPRCITDPVSDRDYTGGLPP